MDEEWIFTFLFDSPLRDRFVRIKGTYDEARAEMFRRFGRKWAFQDETEEEAGVAKYHLTEYVD